MGSSVTILLQTHTHTHPFNGPFTGTTQVSRYSKGKTNLDFTEGIACRILIQNELLEQVDTFQYLGSLITEDGECTTDFCTRLNRGKVIGALLQKIWKSHSTKEWQWHQLGHMQLCTLLQTDNLTSTPPLFYQPDTLPAAQPTASKH